MSHEFLSVHYGYLTALQSFRDVLIPPGKCKGHDRMFKFHTHRYAALLMFFQPVYNFFYQDGDGMSTKELRVGLSNHTSTRTRRLCAACTCTLPLRSLVHVACE